jgi:hypothetical protein
MSWFPIGPDFVFAPRDANFKRLSRRNEVGRQGLVSCIAIDPTDPSTIFVVERPSSGGTGAFRTRDGGDSWVSIVDSLQPNDPSIDPSWIAINPVAPQRIYMATWCNMGVFFSNDRGDTWTRVGTIPGNVRKLIVDPRTASSPGSTVLYAISTAGVHRSPDGGASWTIVLAGDVWSLVAHMPATGTANFYAGVAQAGIFHTTDPATSWTNLNGAVPGLPAHTVPTLSEPDGNFDFVLLDFCPRNPSRLYAWTTKVACDAGGGNCNLITAALYTTSAPLTSWSTVPTTSPPDPGQGTYDMVFAVAPNSPGDGATDILFFGAIGVFRSTDAGRTWTQDATGFHADQHIFAFFPETPPAGVIPAAYAGNDGGVCVNTRYADPSFPIGTVATDFDESIPYGNVGVWQNLDRGKQSSAVYQYSSDPGISALSYIGCQDTGINAGTGDLGWRGVVDADGGPIAAARGADGVKVWGNWGVPYSIIGINDRGEYSPALFDVRLSSGGQLLASSSNHVVGLDGKCLAGVWEENASTSLTAPIGATGSQVATPGSMADIAVGSLLSIDQDANQETVTVTGVTATTFTATFSKTHAAGVGVQVITTTSLTTAIVGTGSRVATPGSMAGIVSGAVLSIDQDGNQENVTVTAVTATTFTAIFAQPHPAGAPVSLFRSFVGRLGQDFSATQISQNFYDQAPNIVARSPVDPDILFCATPDQRLFTTNSGSSASAATVWTEVRGGKPGGLAMGSIEIDRAGNVYVLLQEPVTTGVGEFSTTSPLFKISGGNWVHQPCLLLPFGSVACFGGSTDPLRFGKLVADPVQPNTLYAGHGVRVYRLTLSAGTWTWQDISDGLPGQWIYDLWVADISPGGGSKVLLRAAIPTRGVWERDVTAGASDPPVALYLRDNLLDQGWLPTPPDGVADPFDPANPGATLYHYMCADIKMDARQLGSASVPDFFQTDPEGTIPPTHVLFEELQDNSQNLPQSDVAYVHVQVHNRSRVPASARVWAIYCRASAGVPALSASPSLGNAFPFWDQFTVLGQITPNLPADSPWTSLGAPQLLTGIDAADPRVASWQWVIPALAPGDPGHYCIVAFVHSAASPITETRFDVDEVTPRNRQVGQKNVHIGPPLPPRPGSGTPAGGGHEPRPSGGSVVSSTSAPPVSAIHEYVEFHNPTPAPREADLLMDLRGLPAPIQISFRLTPIDTVRPLQQSISGAGRARTGIPRRLRAAMGWPFRWIGWLIRLFGCLIVNLGRWVAGLPFESCAPRAHHTYPKFAPAVYEAAPSSLVEVTGVRLAPYGFVAARLTIVNTGQLEEGSEHRFQIQQRVAGRVVGGVAYIVRADGEPKRRPLWVSPSNRPDADPKEVEELERQSERLRYVPPYAAQIVNRRERELGKRP